MDVYAAIAELGSTLMRDSGWSEDSVSAFLDGLCKIRSRKALEEEVAWAMHDNRLAALEVSE